MNIKRKTSILLLVAVFFTLLWSSTAFASSKYVYNGNGTSGWTGSGTFNLATDAGYDGSMYWTWGDSDSCGFWDFGIEADSVRFYVYIPNHNAYATVIYRCYPTMGNRQDIQLNQENYSNQWVLLGRYNTEDQSDTMLCDTTASSSDKVGFDEFCYMY